MLALAVLIALLPVSAFLLVLVLLDSFKLVPTRTLAQALVAGMVAAFLAVAFHAWLLDVSVVDVRSLSRYVAPVTEETLKAFVLLVLVRRYRVGFLVDAAIVGYAVGTGFALLENVEYLRAMTGQPLILWFVRGFGTAILHGVNTAIVAIAVKALGDRHPAHGFLALLPGWLIAVALHGAFNHALVSPVLSAVLLLAVLPLVVLAVFTWSERATREWVGAGLDLDVELLRLVLSAQFGGTRLGRYLAELKTRFPGPVVADMFCLLRLQLELAIRAKGMLMARDAGLDVPVDDDLRARLQELRYLERSIGPTGLLALRPLQVVSDRDRWHRYLLQQAGG